MPIRDLILSQETEQALIDLKRQWVEMAGTANEVLNMFAVSRGGVLSSPDNTVNASLSVSTTLSYATKSVVVKASGKTIFLPPGSSEIVGQDWTVVLGTIGTVTISPKVSDAILLPTTDTSVSLYNKGDSLTFKCLDATTWGMV
jgi:hypothetical protein